MEQSLLDNVDETGKSGTAGRAFRVDYPTEEHTPGDEIKGGRLCGGIGLAQYEACSSGLDPRRSFRGK